MAKILGPGTPAPAFTLNVTADQTISLSDFRGKPLIISFYPADWSPVCSDEMSLLNEALPEFKRLNADLIGISVDGCWCHDAFAKANHFHYPLLADFEPKGKVAKMYGAYHEGTGVCERALFVLDKEGVIAWSYLSPMGENPGADGVLDALENLVKKEGGHVDSKSSSVAG